MRYRRDGDDGGFGSGMGGTFGTSGGYDPHRRWDGPLVTRGVEREGSRIPRDHEDDHTSEYEARRQEGFRGYGASAEQWHGGQVNGPPYPPHHQQHGYGLSQYTYPEERQARWGRGMGGTDMGLGERDFDRGPHYGKGPKGYRRSDDRVRDEICDVVARQGYVDASDVEVTVEGGVVRLVGTVESRQDKRALEIMAERVHGVEEVRNEVRLRRHMTREQPPPTSAASSQRGPASQNGNGRTAQS